MPDLLRVNRYGGVTGSTYALILRRIDGKYWSPGSADFITFTSSRDNFDIPMGVNGHTEYTASYPSIESGTRLDVKYFAQIGAFPDDSVDYLIGGDSGRWDGEKLVQVTDLAEDVVLELAEAAEEWEGSDAQADVLSRASQTSVDALGLGVTGEYGRVVWAPKLRMVDASGEEGIPDMKAILVDTRNYTYDTSTSSFSSLIESIVWSRALIPCPEVPGQSGVGLAMYEADPPANFPVGTYTLMFQTGTGVNNPKRAISQIYWDGTNVIPQEGILATVYGRLRAISAVGAGSSSKTVTITASSGAPIPNAVVFVSSDNRNVNVVAGPAVTDDLGQATFLLNPGTYYAWAHRANVNVVNPKMFSVP